MSTAEDRPLSGPLYHYTSIDVLMSIVESGEFWASNIFYMNDASEIQYGISQIEVCILGRRDSETDPNTVNTLEYLRDWVLPIKDKYFPLYVACFSELRDDLSQWRSYAPDGGGVCIGFDHMAMHDCFRDQNWDFAHCFYETGSQLNWGDVFVNRALRAVKEQMPDSSAEYSQASYESAFESVRHVLFEVASRIKHTAFKQEREWRLMYMFDTENDGPIIKYRNGGETIIPYIPLNVQHPETGVLKLAEVITGPTSRGKLATESLRSFLYSKGVDVRKVHQSIIPFRNI